MYDPDERINKLADQIDKEAPISRLTLFSPCKVKQLFCCLGLRSYRNQFSCIEIVNLHCVDKRFLENNQQERRWIS